MNIGAMDKRVSLQTPPGTQNSYGEQSGTWVTTDTVWANVISLNGKALLTASQVHNEVSVKVTIRHREGVIPNMRVLYGLRTLEIISVINMGEDKKFLEIMCKEIV